ncbi:MAG: oxidoreductase, partial [Acidimicrobiales bacterium]
LTIVRTELGRQIIIAMLEEGVIEGKPGDSDPGAIALMQRLAKKSRERWPTWASPEARIGLPTKKK